MSKGVSILCSQGDRRGGVRGGGSADEESATPPREGGMGLKGCAGGVHEFCKQVMNESRGCFSVLQHQSVLGIEGKEMDQNHQEVQAEKV